MICLTVFLFFISISNLIQGNYREYPYFRAEVGKLWLTDHIWPTTSLGKLEHNHSYHPYVLSVAPFLQQQQGWLIITETIWSTKPKMFTLWPFTEKNLLPLVIEGKVNKQQKLWGKWLVKPDLSWKYFLNFPLVSKISNFELM